MSNDIEYDYRVYYDDDGAVITYAMQDLPGKWIKITREQFAEANPYCKVIDGKLMKPVRKRLYVKLSKTDANDELVIKTSKHDVCIIVEDEDCDYWKVTSYEKSSRDT
jgi:hypothetical protein